MISPYRYYEALDSFYDSKTRDFSDYLHAVGINEAIFQVILDMDTVQFLQLNIKDNFYISPYLQLICMVHPSMKQILFSYNENRIYQQQSNFQLSDAKSLIAHSSSFSRLFPLCKSKVENFIYSLLPEVQYIYISDLSVFITPHLCYGGSETHIGTTFLDITRESTLQALIDVEQKDALKFSLSK